MSKVDDILLSELGKTRAEIQTRIVSEGKEASGKTGQSMKEVSLGRARAGIEGFRYAGVMEKARRPGAVPADIQIIIRQWAISKGIASRMSASELSRFIYNTARSMKAVGANPRFTRDIFATPLQNLENRLPLVLGEEFVAEILNNVFDTKK